MKLPTRRELPDYYDIIKKPVDISKILSRIDDGKVTIFNVTREVRSSKLTHLLYENLK